MPEDTFGAGFPDGPSLGWKPERYLKASRESGRVHGRGVGAADGQLVHVTDRAFGAPR